MNAAQYNGKFHRASEAAPGVLLLELNRAPVNAFHDDFWIEMRQIVERISDDGNVRVIVLSSALEKFFTAGLDLNNTQLKKGRAFVDPARTAIDMHEHVRAFQDAISSLEYCRQPVIAAMYGHTLGLAIDMASACDIRLCASNVQMGIMEVKVGLAADIGTLQRFPKIVGNGSKARELAMTGRKFGAAEAKEMGFVSDVIEGGRAEVIAAAVKVGAEIAANSPIAVISTKHIMNHARDHSVEEGLRYQAAWNMAMLQSEDTKQSMIAVMQKKQAEYRPFNAKL